MSRSRGLVGLLSLMTLVSACTGSAPTAAPRAASTMSKNGVSTPTMSSPVARRIVRRSDLLPGMPAPLSHDDVYAADRPGNLSPVVRHDLALVYVPNTISNTVTEIDQRTLRVVRTFAVGKQPQHVVPSYDLRTLYVASDQGRPATAGGSAGTLTPIDPHTGKPGRAIPVLDPYNLYFTPDGRYAIVVAEARRQLEFYNPHTWKLVHSLALPSCAGVDHMDFTANGRTLLASCEFSDSVIAVDVAEQRLLRTIVLPRRADGMPQDVKLSPDGSVFYVADMIANGVYLIDGSARRVLSFLPTGRGAHGLYVDRSSTRLFVSNRTAGSVSVIDLRTRRVSVTWRLPGQTSPDMGNVSANGTRLWLSGRYNSHVYVIDTANGQLLKSIAVGAGPHGLCVWPQPGRYSLGHTGILR